MGSRNYFGTEPNKDLLIDFLNQILPEKHHIQDLTYARTEHLGNSEADRKAVFDLYCIGANGDRIFQKVFETAEIAKFSPDDKVKYEESLKYYRDLKNVVDTAYEEGKAKRNIEIARQMKAHGEPVEKIIRYTGLSAQDIENI